MAPLVYFVFWYIRCVMSLFKFIFFCALEDIFKYFIRLLGTLFYVRL